MLMANGGARSYAMPVRHPLQLPIAGTVEVGNPAPPVTGTTSPINYSGGPTIAPIPTSTGSGGGTVSDSGSGGAAMSGLDDLFSSIGSMFNNLTHPGADQTGTQTSATSSGSLLTWAVIALVIYFLFIR